MKLYIAGGSTERTTIARHWIDLAKSSGFTVTHDWSRCEGYTLDPTSADFRRYAADDLAGVLTAETLWLILPSEKSEGASAELGAALALHKWVVVSGVGAERNIFTRLANEVHAEHHEAFSSLCRRAGM